MNRVVVYVIAVLVALLVVPLATAQNGTSQAGYGGEAAVQVTLVESSQASAGGSSGQSLPLTGADLGLFVAAGFVLVLVGFGMRRLARQRQ